MKRRGIAKASTDEHTMAIGAGGCHRCSGWVIESIDFIFSESGVQPCFRCLICGARRYLVDVSSQERQEARGRCRKRGADLDGDPAEGPGGGQVLYAYTPAGKRMVKCGCNDSFDAHDEGTACFEDGRWSEPCPACGYYPWYRIIAERGGSRRRGDERARQEGTEENKDESTI